MTRGIVRLPRLAATVVFFFLLVGSSLADILGGDALELKAAPEIERLYFVKITENALFENAKKMIDDPENAIDEFLWARKVMAYSNAQLRDLAVELSVAKLAVLYEEKAGYFARNIRGELSTDEFRDLEADLEQRKRTYFDTVLQTTKLTRRPDFDTLKAVATATAINIHTASVLAAGD